MLTNVPIKRRKISDEVADRLEAMISEQGLKVGDPLPSEREIMDAYNVGRSAVREALFSLTRRGLVEVRNGERARVATPDVSVLIDEMGGAARRMLSAEEGIHQFQDARRLFEVGVAARAAQRATDADLDGLAQTLEANRKAIGNQPAFEQTDFLFHRQIAVVAHNPIFLAVTEALVTWLLEQRRAGSAPGMAEIAYQAHKDIFDAIAKRDPVAASDAMDRHLQVVERLYWGGSL